MANEIKKEAILKLQDEPYLKPISNTGVGFYNLDINTAVLTFQVSKKGEPLLISGENAHSYAYFKSDNGSVSGVLDLEYKDPLNGIVTITLPTDFLQASSGSTVTGQMYITVNKWTNTPNDKSDTAVLSEFTFTVKDALINTISGQTKIEYIRMFDVLKQQIQQRVNDIEEAIANGEDYVAEMKMTLESGKKELNDVVERSKTSVQTTVDQAITNVNTTRDNAVSKITDLSEETSTYVKNTTDTAIQNVTGFSNETISHVDSKVDEFNQIIEENGFLTPEVFNEEVESLSWQKYKLTNEDGSRVYMPNIETTDITTLPTGLYEITTTSNTDWDLCKIPDFPNIRVGHIASLDVTTSNTGRKQFTYRHNHYNRIFVATLNTNGAWREWKEVTSEQTDTGWLPITIKNGYNKSAIPDYDPSYRVIDYGTHKKVFVRVGVTGILSGKNVIASIPSEFNPYKIYSLGASTIAKIPPKVVVAGGNIEFHPNSSDNYISTDYVIYQGEWII
ncbi:BppU family phage baseplate upper protein [Staphylococcus sp. GDY8P193P]|uniref:BppU family phage baseplate upper protein n=1 Tax=Staphylococcus sp. GDY8P193P TaxID=2804171 RepID=UPI001AEC1049|nr:BppU family phage baseplate upper protein [Staphylococcus sp. GDY8P193P]